MVLIPFIYQFEVFYWYFNERYVVELMQQDYIEGSYGERKLKKFLWVFLTILVVGIEFLHRLREASSELIF